MDCILYIDVLFLLNFWMNALVLFLLRHITKTYRTGWCLLAAAVGALGTCMVITGFILRTNTGMLLAGQAVTVLIMIVLAFGRRNLLWHLFLFLLTGAGVAGVFSYLASFLQENGSTMVAVGMVSITAGLFCILLEKNSRIRWKEEHMKAKTVLEFGSRRLVATALVDTGNKLYDPIFHKPVILVDEKMIKDTLAWCREECPERLHYIPFHSVGQEHGMLEAMTFERVSIQWQDKKLVLREVIAAATKESLYQGKEYQVIFHCGLLQEG